MLAQWMIQKGTIPIAGEYSVGDVASGLATSIDLMVAVQAPAPFGTSAAVADAVELVEIKTGRKDLWRESFGIAMAGIPVRYSAAPATQALFQIMIGAYLFSLYRPTVYLYSVAVCHVDDDGTVEWRRYSWQPLKETARVVFEALKLAAQKKKARSKKKSKSQ